MNYFLQDSGTNNWQLGITTLGDLTTTPTGPQTIVQLVLFDGTQYWQLGVTTSGDLTQTVVSPTTVTPITLIDSSGGQWVVTIDTNGDLHQQFTGFSIVPAGAADSGPDFQWLGGDY